MSPWGHLRSMTKFKLTRKERRALERLRRDAKDKLEYIRATCLLMRWRGEEAKDVAKQLSVSMGAVFKWEHNFRERGVEALRTKKPPGRPSVKEEQAKKLVPELMKKDPKLFGFLKGRWVVRDLARALEGEGLDISPTHVHRMLGELGLSYKRPKLDVRSNDSNYARKERQVNNYKRVAPALAKRG